MHLCAVERQFVLPPEDTDFGASAREKLLKKIRSEQSVSECEV